MPTVLDAVEPFTRLTAAERQRLSTLCREQPCAKGETIFREGDPADAVWVVKTGRVHLMRYLESGQVSTTCVMSAGETFCCLPALDRKPYPVDAVAAVDSVVVRIPTRAFHALMERDPTFLQGALCLFCDRLRQVEGRSCRAYESIERRLAQELLALSRKFGDRIPLTKHELAEMAHTTVETTIRTLSQLAKRGILRSTRGATTIVKPDQLQRLADSSRHQ